MSMFHFNFRHARFDLYITIDDGEEYDIGIHGTFLDILTGYEEDMKHLVWSILTMLVSHCIKHDVSLIEYITYLLV